MCFCSIGVQGVQVEEIYDLQKPLEGYDNYQDDMHKYLFYSFYTCMYAKPGSDIE